MQTKTTGELIQDMFNVGLDYAEAARNRSEALLSHGLGTPEYVAAADAHNAASRAFTSAYGAARAAADREAATC